MLKHLNNQLTSHQTSEVVLDENEVKLESFTAYPAIKETLTQSIAEERSLFGRHETLKTNSVEARDQERSTAVEYIVDLASREYSFAYVTKNQTLLNSVRFPVSKVNRFSDNKIVVTLENLLATANENKQQVLEYGVTVQMLTKGTTILANLKTEVQNFRTCKVGLKQLTGQLKNQFSVTNSIFRTIDTMIQTMRYSDPVFHSTYRTARRTMNTGVTKLSAMGKVFDAATGLPLPKAKISILSYNSSKELSSGADLIKNVKIAGALGGFQLKSLATGTYIFRVSYAGYADQEITVHINEGVLTHVEIHMVKLEHDAV